MLRPSRSEVHAVLVPFVLSRVIVVVALAATRRLLAVTQVGSALRGSAGLVTWDAAWYRDIAAGGYGAVQAEGLRFFPAFPAFGAAVGVVPGVTPSAAVVVAANLCALVLGFAVYRLVVAERSDRQLARRAVYLVYLLPPAYVLVMGYAEALFMTATTVALLGLRTRRWALAAAAALLAGLTRPIGVLLVVPALVELYQTRKPQALVPAVAPVAGVVAYLSWARSRTNDFWYPLTVQQEQARRGGWIDPVRGVAHAVGEAAGGDHVTAGLHALVALGLVALLVVLARRWPLSFTCYAAVSLAVFLSGRNLDSLERYALSTVPFVLAGADLLRRDEVKRAVFLLSAAGLAIAAVLAFGGALVP